MEIIHKYPKEVTNELTLISFHVIFESKKIDKSEATFELIQKSVKRLVKCAEIDCTSEYMNDDVLKYSDISFHIRFLRIPFGLLHKTQKCT